MLNLLGVLVGGVPVARRSWSIAAFFSGTPLSGPPEFTVQFTDESVGSVTEWRWKKRLTGTQTWADFAGEPTSQNPAEDFGAGTWDVQLTITGPAGTRTRTKIAYVTAS